MQGLVLSAVSGIRWGSWNIFPPIKGDYSIRQLMAFRENCVKCIRPSLNMDVLLDITFVQRTFKTRISYAKNRQVKSIDLMLYLMKISDNISYTMQIFD